MVQLFKGMNNKVIREEFPELNPCGIKAWTDEYFAETSGQICEDQIHEYIHDQ
jgi:REP element-mobilizing transposase RayT